MHEIFDDHGFWSCIALGSQDNPHIAYFNGSGLQYAFFDGFTWHKRTVDRDSLQGLSKPVVALDSLNRPYIVYSGGPAETSRQFKYAFFDGSSWNVQTIDGEGYGASMAVDSSGKVHVSYINATALKYAYFDGSSWSIGVVTTVGGVSETSIAVDSESRPHIVYQSGRLMYAYYGSNSWNIATINESEGYDPGPFGSGGWYSSMYWSPSLTVGSDDKLRLSGIGGKYNSELRYGVGTKQYLTDFEFNDIHGTRLSTQPSLIEINCPKIEEIPSRSLTLTNLSNQWLDTGKWTLQRAICQGNDVTPSIISEYSPTLGGTWSVNCRVYPFIETPLGLAILFGGTIAVISVSLLVFTIRKRRRARHARTPMPKAIV